MASHSTGHELDLIASRHAHDTPADLLELIEKKVAIRRAMRRKTHKRGRSETRGRKNALSPARFKKLNVRRRALIKKADAEKEVTYDMIIRSAIAQQSRGTWRLIKFAVVACGRSPHKLVCKKNEILN